MASKHTPNSASYISEMQRRTRKERNFDEFEAGLPDPKSFSNVVNNMPSVSRWSLGDVVKRIGDANPFGRPVSEGDTVWLLDNTAFRTSQRTWQAEYVAAVFERDCHCQVADIVSRIAKTVGLADDAAERDAIEERLLPFLWDVRLAKIVKVNNQNKELRLTPTNVNGISAEVTNVPTAGHGQSVRSVAKVPGEVNGILEAKTFYAGPEGWGIISDVDDTIKITLTGDPSGIVRETFVEPATPVPGMPELYKDIKSYLPRDTPWFYLSASPYNLYPFLREFREKHYPPGTLILRDFSWKTVSGLLTALTMGTEDYKTDRMKKINSWLPKRKMIVIGDSTQSDPEAYADIYRAVPGWIKLILIRKVTDIAAVGIEEKNEPQRFEKAFEGIPRGDWHVFEDPAECLRIVKSVVKQG